MKFKVFYDDKKAAFQVNCLKGKNEQMNNHVKFKTIDILNDEFKIAAMNSIKTFEVEAANRQIHKINDDIKLLISQRQEIIKGIREKYHKLIICACENVKDNHPEFYI